MKSLVITPPFLEPFRPPISGATICAVAESAGHSVTAWDPNIEIFNKVGYSEFYNYRLQFVGLQDTQPESIEFLEKFYSTYNFSDFDYILVSVFSSHEIKSTEILLKTIKSKNVKAKIVIGGSGIETVRGGKRFADLMLNLKLCDYYILGEGEHALLELFNGNDTYYGINGKPPKQIENIDLLPTPNYDYYNRESYDYQIKEQPDLFIYGSRGCVRKCNFCDVPYFWPKFRYRSGKNLATEIIKNYEKYGIYRYFFVDSLMNGSIKAYREFYNELAKYPNLPKFHFAGYAIVRPRHQHPEELFDMMHETASHFWSIGIEHGSEAMRDDMKKKFSNEDIDYHLEQSERIGLANHWLLMPTWPTEKIEHHLEYLKMFKRYQRYVASGTITSVVIAPATMALDNTPLTSDNHHYDLEFDTKYIEDLREYLWINKNNPELDEKERFRRTLAIWKEAIKYKWPMQEAELKLITIHRLLQKVNQYKNGKS